MKSLRWALLGCGRIGRAHAALLKSEAEMELVGAYDPSDSSVMAAGLESMRISTLSELSSLGADVALIAAPNGLHAELAIRAIESGLHAVIEKPMALSRADSERILQKALERGKQVFVVMQNRHSPVARWLKQAVSQGRLGDLRMADVRCYWNRDERYYGETVGSKGWHGQLALDGGPLFTQFSHFVDTLYWLFGPLRLAAPPVFANYTHASNTEFEDSGLIHFHLADSALGSLAYTTAVPESNFESSISLIGSKGVVKISGQYLERLEYCSLAEVEGGEFDRLRAEASAEGVQELNRSSVHRNVLSVLRGEAAVGTTALEGLKVVEFIEKVYKLRPKAPL